MEETDLHIIREFVMESGENLDRLDRELVELERRPKDAKLLASVFRTIHTIKGTCGFLGYRTIERVAHHAENVLGQIRDGERQLTPQVVSLILETVDAIKTELTSIAATSTESGAAHADFRGRPEAAGSGAAGQRLNRIPIERQTSVTKTRMQPIGTIWNKLPRVVRDLASVCGKQIGLELDGADTMLDKTIIEAIRDPLVHIIRNSCDHGIEPPGERVRAGKPAQGRLRLRAFHESGNVNIEISDDGAGIDPQGLKATALQKGLLGPGQADRMHDRELLHLAFLPGFSTARQVSNISGRGVGMDIVKTNIEEIGGAVEISSSLGQGTVVRIKIPLILATVPQGSAGTSS